MSSSPGDRDPLAQGLAASLMDWDADLAAEVLAEFQRGWQREHVMAAARQTRIAEATQRIERAAVDGIGEMTMRVDPHAYHYWGQRLGYECWKDKAFRDEFKRDNPEVRVKTRPRATTIIKSREVGAAAPAIVLTNRRGTIVPVQ